MKKHLARFIKYTAVLTVSLFIAACSKGDAETSAPAYKQQTAMPVSSIQEQNINEPAAEPSVNYDLDLEDTYIYTDNKLSETENAQQEPDTLKTEEAAKEETPKIDMEKLKICAQAGTCGAAIEDDLTIPTPFTYKDYEGICIKNSHYPYGQNISDSYSSEVKVALPQYYFQDHIFGEYENIFEAIADKCKMEIDTRTHPTCYHNWHKYSNITRCLLDDSLFSNNASRYYLESLEYDKNLMRNLYIRIKGEIKRAIINKDKEKLTELFKDNPDFINSNIYQYYAPLAFAIKQNDKEMAEFLIEQGAQLEGVDFDCGKYGDTSAEDCARESIHPLQAAVNNQNFDIVNFLVSKGANVNNDAYDSSEDVGYTISPLGTSLEFTDKSIAKFLIENGAKLPDGEYIFARFINDAETVKILHSLGIDLSGGHSHEGGEYYRFSDEALIHMNEDVIKYFIANGTNVLSEQGVCWLMAQCCNEKTKNVIKIVFNEENVNMRAYSCFSWRCQQEECYAEESSGSLIGNSLYATPQYDDMISLRTMLMFLQENHPEETELIDFLISKGATPKGNIEDLNNIFISLAKNINRIGENETTWFDKLIEYGADINAKDKEGKTALDYSKYHKEVKDFLISRGAKPAGNSDTANAAAAGD